jgi:ABC-2 type transport system permease protein
LGSTTALAIATLWQRELVRFWREKARVLGFVGSPLVFWLLIGSGFGNLGFFFPGALTLTVMFSAVFSTMSLIEDRREGFLLSMLVSPAPRISMVLGKILGSATLAWIQGVLFLAFAPAAGFRPGLAAVVELIGVIFLVSFSLTAMGFLIAWQMESTQGFHAVMNLILFPLWMVSGALFPISGARAWVKAVIYVNPMTYTLAPIRRLLDSKTPPDVAGIGASVAFTAIFGAVLLLASAILANRKTTRGLA